MLVVVAEGLILPLVTGANISNFEREVNNATRSSFNCLSIP